MTGTTPLHLNDYFSLNFSPVNFFHWNEWLDSAVDPDLIHLNIKSLTGTTPYEYLLYSERLSRRNDGRLSDSILKRYRHLEDGGWWCSGVDPLTDSDSLWGCFKPNNPRIDPEKGKPRKYEHPEKVPTGLFCLRVSWKIGLNIAIKNNFEEAYRNRIAQAHDGISLLQEFLTTEDRQFWPWVKTTNIPILITEGAKKAGSLLTAGYCAIALPGIYGGYRQPKDPLGKKIGLPHLIPELEVFSQQTRELSFCFDRDSKPKTVANVRTAILRTGKLLERAGCQVSVICWNYREKGVDDLIAARGVECFDALYQQRRSLARWKTDGLTLLNPDHRVNQRYLDINPPPDAQLIGLKSAKGTGKTECLSKIVERAIAKGQPCLVIGHRVKLMAELANRFGLSYRTDKDELQGLLGYCLCIDSLHPNANPRFVPQEWEEALIIIDEVEQVIWHLLNSQTCFSNRVAILETFQQLLRTVAATGGQIYTADADLSDLSLDYIKRLLGFPINSWVVENTFNPNRGKRVCHVYQNNSPIKLIADCLEAVKRGERVIIHTGAQKINSQWSTQNLEATFKNQFPEKRILRTDRESVSEKGHPAYEVMGNLNQILPLYDIVICSPTIETGISIDIQHFDSVWCIANGVQTVNAISQTLERVRDDIPRYLWAKTRHNNTIGNGAADEYSLLSSQHQLFKANFNLLSRCDYLSDIQELGQPESLKTWAKYACLLNAQAHRYRPAIVEKLQAEGYEIVFPDDNEGEENREYTPEIAKLIVDDIKENNYLKHCQAVAQTPNPTDEGYLELKDRHSKTQAEHLKEKKGKLCRRYLTETLTPTMVRQDDSGWYPQLLLHYYLSIGQPHLKKRDSERLDDLAANGKGKVFAPDVNKICLSAKVEALKILGVEQFLDQEREFTSLLLQDWFDRLNNPQTRYQIKTILGFRINPEKDTPIGVAQRLLALLGLKLTCIGRLGSRSDRRRVYQLLSLDPDSRGEIFSRWLKRDRQAVSTSSINNYLLGRVA